MGIFVTVSLFFFVFLVEWRQPLYPPPKSFFFFFFFFFFFASHDDRVFIEPHTPRERTPPNLPSVILNKASSFFFFFFGDAYGVVRGKPFGIIVFPSLPLSFFFFFFFLVSFICKNKKTAERNKCRLFLLQFM